MKPIYTFLTALTIILLPACTHEKLQDQSKNKGGNKSIVIDTVPLFWQVACERTEFSNLFDCNNENCYQVELLQDPFKDLIIITLNLQDSLTDIICCNRFAYRIDAEPYLKKHNSAKKLPIVNPVTHDTVFYFYEKTTIIKIKKRRDLNNFFATTIWEMPIIDEKAVLFDPETWSIKGRAGNKKILVRRRTFNDAVFYTNIQKLLDICKISDYKYIKR